MAEISIAKVFIILTALFDIALIAIATMFGKTRIAIALRAFTSISCGVEQLLLEKLLEEFVYFIHE